MIAWTDMVKTEHQEFSGSIFEPLLELHDCPSHIYSVGTIPRLGSVKLITIVGSRSHSAYARQALEYLMSGLAGQSICIVSGMALGIDALAHRLALQYNIPSIAVPGSGLDESVLYPVTNRHLADEIVQLGGLVISEFEPKDRAAKWTFPKRNRIMACMSDLVLVVEASERSGTLITARMATEYNTQLAVIPNTIFAETARGSNDLIRQGAYPIFCANDILELLGITASVPRDKTYPDVSPEEMLIIELLVEPRSRDDLVLRTQYNSQKLSSLISLLEIKGHVKEQLGLIYKI